tara:strand:+ start:276 stop:761 length:486 start_codon:yes stop_codon:yes gene_type:complete
MIGSDKYTNTGQVFYDSGIIEDRIIERQWTLNDIINKQDTVSALAKELISEMDIETMYWIVCDTNIPSGTMSFAKAIGNRAFEIVEEWITAKLSVYLKTATVNFNEETKEETKEEMGKGEGKLERLDENAINDEKIVSLKERIKTDTHQLTESEMKKKGMI